MDTKLKIMHSAFTLFAKKGISFTLSEVAKEVGIKKASIYAHFENKDTLLHEVIDQEIIKYFFEINQEKDELKKIFFGVLDYYNDSQIKLLFWKRLLLLPPENIDQDILDKIQHMSDERFRIVRALVQKNSELGVYRPGSDDEITLMFFSLIHGLLSSVLIYHPQEIKQHYNTIWTFFWNSIIIN